jgi:Tol biopolymer transport system component
MRRVLIATIAAVVVSGPASHAAFPGANGLIAYSAQVGGSLDIFVSNADGSHARNVTDTRGVDEFSPALAPDGRTIAYAFAARNQNSDLALITAAGTGKRRVTDTADVAEASPAFSPDGEAIAFIAQDDAGSSDVWSVSLGPSPEPTQLTTDGRAVPFGLSWHPDGSAIAFPRLRIGLGYAIDLYQVPAAGGDATALVEVETGTEAREPDFSPDGSRVAYLLRTDVSRRSAYVSPVAGGEPQEVEARPGHEHLSVAWAPNGRRIVVYDKTSRGGALVTYAAAGGDRELMRWEDALDVNWGRCRRGCPIDAKQPTETAIRRAETVAGGVAVDFEVYARHAGHKVAATLQRKRGDKWLTVARYLVPLSRTGLTSTTLPERPEAASCRVVVRFRGDDDHKTSRARRTFSCRG